MTGQLPAAFGETKNALPALVAAAGERASMRFLEFFDRPVIPLAPELIDWEASSFTTALEPQRM
jgi:hypothetical protein